MIQDKFEQYFHSKGFKIIQSRAGDIYLDETMSNGSKRTKLLRYIEQDGKKILLSEFPISGLLSLDVKESKIKDEQWSLFFDCVQPLDEEQINIKRKNIDIAEMYSFLVERYEENKRGILSLNEAILKSLNKYGMLTIGEYWTKEWWAGEYINEKGLKSYGAYKPRAKKVFEIKKIDAGEKILRKQKEYQAWIFVFMSLIPSTLKYVSDKNYELTIEMLNHRIKNMNIEFEGVNNNKLKVTPNDLLSALILYTKTKSQKKLPLVNCLYCGKQFKQKIGRGRPQKFCSPSHTNMYTLKQRNKLKGKLTRK